jgi:hypothetical protein
MHYNFLNSSSQDSEYDGGDDGADREDSMDAGSLDHAMTKFLTYLSADQESEFMSYFFQQNLTRWKHTNSLLFVILSCLYLYLVAKNTIDSRTWKNEFSWDTKVQYNSTSLSRGPFQGWYM